MLSSSHPHDQQLYLQHHPSLYKISCKYTNFRSSTILKEGFFPNLERKGKIRYFSDNELEALRIIECLKKSGLEIKDIKQFFIWVSEGSSSYEKRKELFETRKSAVETEIQELQKTLSLLKFKCWYYETAMKDGNEDAINAMLPDKLPKNIQKLYDKGHD